MTEEHHLDRRGAAASPPRSVPTLIWIALFVVLALWVADRAGAFDLWRTVRMANGREVRLPNVYWTVDHPFHATRAELLRRALGDGQSLRWIGSHQGGYPVEFYPLGVAGLEVVVWGLLLGSLPIVLVHKLVVVLIFLAPGLAYALAAHRDRMPLGVGLVALAAHVVVRGWWWSGGYQELVEWGLVTNVAAAVAALFVLVFLTSYLRWGRGWEGALAALCGGFCLYSNPRSGIALVIVGLGAAVAVGLGERGPFQSYVAPPWRGAEDPALNLRSPLKRAESSWRQVVGRLAIVGGAVALIAAPEIVSLLRFEHLYYFVQYERYEDLAAYWHSSIQAVSGPVFVAGTAGLVTGLAMPGRPVTRAAAVTLALYFIATGLLGTGSGSGRVVEQLEATRLMPFQRLLVCFLAAVAIHDAAWWLFSLWSRARGLATDAALIVVAAALPILYVISPPGWIPVGDRGLVEVATAADASIADLEEAVRVADAGAAPGTALLVLGSTVSWHSNLWGPRWSERPFYFDDWLWYWQTRHVGPYDPLTEHAYRPSEMAQVVSPAYLQEHGIGAVILTGTARTEAAARAAMTTPNLELVRRGVYDVYLVRNPGTIVTIEGANAETIAVSDQMVEASGTSAGGTAVIRRNWFPRWRAWVNGERTPITEMDDGYMSVPVPSGPVTIELRYTVDRWDWMARAMCVLGLVIAGLLAIPRVRWVRR